MRTITNCKQYQLRNQSSGFGLGKTLADMVGIVSASGLILICLGLLLPVVIDRVDAIEDSVGDYVVPTISLALDQTEVAVDIAPASGGKTGESSARLSVATTNGAGYSIYLNTLDNTNAMVSADGNQAYNIKSIDQHQLIGDFGVNSWGVRLEREGGAGQYQPVSLAPVVVASSSRATTADTYEFNVGANIDTSLPAGQYSNNIQISAVANPAVISNLSQLVYMQDMTSGICANTKGMDGSVKQVSATDSAGAKLLTYEVTVGNEVSKQLIDIRDGKTYWVSKLADENCWMVQNLALDLSNDKALTSLDTDILANGVHKGSWIPSISTAKTIPAADQAINAWSATSWDLGEYVTVYPNANSPCVIAAGTTNLETACPNKLKNVAGWASSSEPVAMDNSGEPAIDAATKTYDAHYLLGNYYSWTAATVAELGAGNFSPDEGKTDPAALRNAQQSICPKGWKLPVSGRNWTTGQPFALDDSFYALLYAYGYPRTGEYTQNGNNGYTSYANAEVFDAPLYFTRAGHLEGRGGELRGVASSVSFWSSTLHTDGAADWSTQAYYFVFDGAIFYPAHGAGRYNGNAVRCLAR